MRRPRSILAAAATTLLTAAGLVAIQLVAVPPQPALALENGLARTPPMGFNNWTYAKPGPYHRSCRSGPGQDGRNPTEPGATPP